MSKVWLLADTHFNHKRILSYEPRRVKMLGMQSEDINEMNEKIIERWNGTVKPEDVVYHLGDVSFGRFDVSCLNGYKILIRGNHDHKNKDKLLEQGWDEVHDLKVVQVYDKFWLLTHEPFLGDFYNFPFNDFGDGGVISYNIHGHLHSKSLPTNRHICVSMEQIDCTPISLEDIIKKIKLLEANKRTVEKFSECLNMLED